MKGWVKNPHEKGKKWEFPTFLKKIWIFFKKRCWQMSLGMILYMSCQRDSDTRELKKLISKPKTSDFNWNFGFKKKLKNFEKKCLTSWKQCDIINEFTSVNEKHRTLKIEQHESKQSWWWLQRIKLISLKLKVLYKRKWFRLKVKFQILLYD